MSSEEMPIIEDVSVRRIFNQSRNKKTIMHVRAHKDLLTGLCNLLCSFGKISVQTSDVCN